MLKIRWKLLILLLAVAVLPLLVVRIVDALSTRKLGRSLADHAGTAMADAAKDQLRQTIRNYTTSLEREERLLKLMLLDQARAVEQRLADPPPTDPLRVWFDSDFRAEPPAVPGLEPSAVHGVLMADGRDEPQRVSYETQVIRLAPGVAPDAVADDIARLSTMTEPYRRLREFFPEAVLWQYTSLASGVHSSYPGKGNYPPDYEPRERPWYRQAMAMDDVCWIPPTADLTTRRATMALSVKVRGPTGEAAGVTGIDVPVTAVLGRPRIDADWASASRRMLITVEKVDFVREIGLEVESDAVGEVALVFAESGQDETAMDWQTPARLRALRADDPAQVAELVRQVESNEAGWMLTRVDGQEQLWAWGVLGGGGNVALLVTVPREAVLADARRLEGETLNAAWASLRSSAVVVGVVLMIVVLAVWRGSRAVSQPVLKLADATRRVADGDFNARVRLRQRIPDEFTAVAESFNAMVPQLAERLQMRQSLDLAMEVQQSLLPTTAPTFEGLDVAGRSEYCDETGGDYYDFLEFERLGSKRLGVAIGDVVGHGIAAALLMATTRALLRSRVAMPGSLVDVFNDINAHLCEGRFTGRFMTLFYLVIDTESREIRWLSAGHDPAIVYDPDRDAFAELAGEDIPLGVDGQWRYSEQSRVGWTPGQVLVLGTDGIWEARNRQHEMFGKQRMREIIRQNARQPAELITQAIHDAVRLFRGEEDQQDDITLVVIKTTG